MKIFNDHNIIKNNLLLVLKGLEHELDATQSLDYRAMQSLKTNYANVGWCELLYSQEAEQLWNEQLTITPEDVETIHHLAILHHARAFDLEFGKNPKESDSDWIRAYELWKYLQSNTEFWKKFPGGFAAREINSVKEQLIIRVLTVHFSIAYNAETTLGRAKFHLNMASQSGNPQETIQKIRETVYEQFIRDFPDEVWIGNVIDIDILNQTCNKIKKILDLDKDCLPALIDIIRIQYRALECLAHKKHENQNNEKEFQKVRAELNDTANEWYPYFNLCVLNKERLDYDLKEKLVTWYKFMGNTKSEVKDWKTALHFFENIVLLDFFEDDTSKQDALDAIPIYHAAYARDLAEKKSNAAMAECSKADARNHHNPISCFLLSQAYQALSDFDAAIRTCKKGITLSETIGNEAYSQKGDMIIWKERLSEFLKSLEIGKAIHDAQEAMKTKNYQQAITILSNPIQQGIENIYIYFFRCKCYLEQKMINEAKLDFQKVKELAQTNEEKEAVTILSKQIEQADAEPYFEKAIEAMKEKNYTGGIIHINKAIEKGFVCFSALFLRCQCYMGLNDHKKAIKDLKKAEALAQTDDEKKAVKNMKKILFLEPLSDSDIYQIANELLAQLKTGLPHNIRLIETNCLSKLIFLLKKKSKKWSKNSVSDVMQEFMDDSKRNPSYYYERLYY